MGLPKTDLEALVRKVDEMTVAAQLRLAAGLLEHDRADLAESIAERAIDRLKFDRLYPLKKG